MSFDRGHIDSFIITTNPGLMTYDKNELNEYIELCRSRLLSPLIKNLNLLLLLSEEIIRELKKEYHLR